jgi:four helix bundle protein
MHRYNDLRLYDQALTFTEVIYLYSAYLPNAEKYGLVSQIRRAAISIPSNIAEGCGRGTNRDTARFISIAIGSLYELDTQLRLCDRLGYGSTAHLEDEILSLKKQLNAFRSYLLKNQ